RRSSSSSPCRSTGAANRCASSISKRCSPGSSFRSLGATPTKLVEPAGAGSDLYGRAVLRDASHDRLGEVDHRLPIGVLVVVLRVGPAAFLLGDSAHQPAFDQAVAAVG